MGASANGLEEGGGSNPPVMNILYLLVNSAHNQTEEEYMHVYRLQKKYCSGRTYNRIRKVVDEGGRDRRGGRGREVVEMATPRELGGREVVEMGYS